MLRVSVFFLRDLVVTFVFSLVCMVCDIFRISVFLSNYIGIYTTFLLISLLFV